MDPTEAGKKRKRRKSRKSHMKVLSLTEGGIRTVLYLARLGQGRWVTGEEICRTQEINPSYLAKITGPLLKRGILSAVRGVGGGFRLGRPADTISLLEVVSCQAPWTSRPGSLQRFLPRKPSVISRIDTIRMSMGS